MCCGLKTVDIGGILFDCDWCCSLLSFVAVSGHVPDDATMTAGASELRFSGTQCLSFAFVSLAIFAFGRGSGVPRCCLFSFLASFAFTFVCASPPSSHSSRRIELEVS